MVLPSHEVPATLKFIPRAAAINSMSDTLSQQTLQRIRKRLDELGDIPIFSASVNRVQAIGSDPNADAMALAVEILKDASLTTKLLRLANSPAYNRGAGKVANLSRAVVLLGFDTVRGVVLTLKLIDGFQQQNPDVDMTGMLVSAYLGAGFVRGVASRCGVRDVEQAYICGLLHNLGQIVTAYALPQEYAQILALRKDRGLPAHKAEGHILGTTLNEIGQAIANDWEFPQSVSQSLMPPRHHGRSPLRNQAELTASLASLATQTMELLYAEQPATDRMLPELISQLSGISGIAREQVNEALEQAFRQCCDMAQDYGLDRRHLTPRLRTDSADESLDRLARQFSFYVHQELPAPNIDSSPTPAADPAPGNPGHLLNCLYDITELITRQASINEILARVLDALQRGAGFDRAILCLLSPDHRCYAGRLSAGVNSETLMTHCNAPLDTEHDLFSRIIMDGAELLVTDMDKQARQLPPGFAEASGTHSFIVAGLRGKQRPVGMLYADRALCRHAIDDDAQRNFRQLVAQAQLALQMR